MPPELLICRDPEDLADRAAGFIIQTAREAVAARGRFTLALAGGSTPEKTYGFLAAPTRAGQMDCARTLLLFGDERLVPHDDPCSNFAMAKRSLLDRVPVPTNQVFPIPTDEEAGACAKTYSATLARAFGIEPGKVPPRFDLVLLGLGDDGHTASLFPGKPTLDVTDAWVTDSPPGVLPPPVDRITLTYPVLNAARNVAFLVAGGKKAAVVREILEGQTGRPLLPAARVRPVEGRVTWFLDEAAAALLTRA
jgi:6-phosphogluconolactonase